MSSTKDLGAVTAYAEAVEGGYTGTYAQFCDLLAKFAERADEVKTNTETVASNLKKAQTAAETAEEKASDAAKSAAAASNSATNAATSEENAASSASTATTKATAAATSEANAAASATAAAESAAQALTTTPEGYNTLVDQIGNVKLSITSEGLLHIEEKEA